MTACRYRPLFGRVLIEREVKQKIGSIFIPENQQKRIAACNGRIIALGDTAGFSRAPDTDEVTRVIRIGDAVIFGRHAGAWLDNTYKATDNASDDAPYFLCQDEDLLAVIEEA